MRMVHHLRRSRAPRCWKLVCRTGVWVILISPRIVISKFSGTVANADEGNVARPNRIQIVLMNLMMFEVRSSRCIIVLDRVLLDEIFYHRVTQRPNCLTNSKCLLTEFSRFKCKKLSKASIRDFIRVRRDHNRTLTDQEQRKNTVLANYHFCLTSDNRPHKQLQNNHFG